LYDKITLVVEKLKTPEYTLSNQLLIYVKLFSFSSLTLSFPPEEIFVNQNCSLADFAR